MQPKQSVIFNSFCHLVRYLARVTVKRNNQPNSNNKKKPNSKTQSTMFLHLLLRLLT